MEGYLFRNWANTFSCRPELYFEPKDVEELIQIVKRAQDEGKRVKVFGGRHSPSDIACTSGFLINMKHINNVLKVDIDKHQVKVEAGVYLKTLNTEILPKHGLALQLLGAISEQSIAGAISTGTHGSGFNHGVMGTTIIEMDILTADGEIMNCSETHNSDILSAARCGLAALGIITAVTIQCEPAFKLHEVQNSTTLDDVLDNLDSYVEASEHFRFFWYPHTDYVVMFRANRTHKRLAENPTPSHTNFSQGDAANLVHTSVKSPSHCISKSQLLGNTSSWFWDTFVENYTFEFLFWLSNFWEPLIPWINRLHFALFGSLPIERVDTSYKVFNFDCLFQQYVTDWAIPREKTGEVLRELRRYCNSSSVYGHFPAEVRFVKADDIMLSPAYRRETCFINIRHFKPYGKGSLNTKYWAVYEDVMRRAGGRPHWAKAHPLKFKDFADLYPDWHQFCEIRKRLDPHGMFMNAYLERVLLE